MQDIFAILCPDGALGYGDMKQCCNEKWVPIATFQEGDQITALCFTEHETARKFIKRNYPKDWVRGVIALSKGELEWMYKKGWNIRILTYPNLYKDLKGFGFEVLEFQTQPDLFMARS